MSCNKNRESSHEPNAFAKTFDVSTHLQFSLRLSKLVIPLSFSVDSSGNFYVSDGQGLRTIQLSPRGELIQVFSKPDSVPLKQPSMFRCCVAAQDRVINYYGSGVIAYTLEGRQTETFCVPPTLVAMTWDKTRSCFSLAFQLAEEKRYSVRRYDVHFSLIAEHQFALPFPEVIFPVIVRFGDNGDLYVLQAARPCNLIRLFLENISFLTFESIEEHLPSVWVADENGNKLGPGISFTDMTLRQPFKEILLLEQNDDRLYVFADYGHFRGWGKLPQHLDLICSDLQGTLYGLQTMFEGYNRKDEWLNIYELRISWRKNCGLGVAH